MDATLPRTNRPRSRQSLAHPPSSSSIVDRENATADVSSLQKSSVSVAKPEKKKSRGKSLGPGGLEALGDTTGNITKALLSAQPKSILKPTVPLTPPKAIPSFDELRKRSTGKAKSPAKAGLDELLIDFSTPGPARNAPALEVPVSGSEGVLDPFSPMTRKSPRGQAVAVRSEEDQHNAAREREAESRRQSQKQQILDQRAARRKSMANRRVSFAPEATLHTWSVMELPEDSTTSSASNSTRRQSSLTAQQSPVVPDVPSTPPEQAGDPLVKAPPTHQEDVHQAKHRRRSSGIPAAGNDTEADVFSSSPSGDVSVLESPARGEDTVNSDDTSDDDGDTAMSMDITGQSIASEGSSSTQSSLDERLRRAASQAGTRGIDYDEHGDDLPMELATGTITNAFQPWMNRASSGPAEDLGAMHDQENVNPFAAAFKDRSSGEQASTDETQDLDQTMEVTKSIGRILPKNSSPGKNRRKSAAGSRRRSSVARRRSSGDVSSCGDESMDLTTVGGGIIRRLDHAENVEAGNESVAISDEDLSMDFTNVLGGVLNNASTGRRESMKSEQTEDNETMDMTAAVGGILPPIEEQTEPMTDVEDNDTTSMDMTRAVGSILPSQAYEDGILAKEVMRAEVEGSPAMTRTQISVASETGSPSIMLKPRLSGRRQSASTCQSTTPKGTPQRMSASPLRQMTPTKQATPLPSHAETPNKTPVLANVTHRSASPKKLFKAEIQALASPANKAKSPARSSNPLFAVDDKTGQQTPSVVLHAPKPHQHLRRRSSGIGIDQDGMGSPRVSELLSRRTSIGEVASTYVPQGPENRNLRFEDPRVLEREIDAERAHEERRESGRFIMEQEADEPQEENATLQLREMIESMTPKKANGSKLKGRKSLAVGGARGLLGKRPAELDMDEEDGEITPKRLKVVSRETSPVKQIHLPKPPTKNETSRRLTRPSAPNFEQSGTATPTTLRSPSKKSSAPSPSHTGHFKELALGDGLQRPSSFEDKLDNVMDAVDVSTAQLENNKQGDTKEEKIPLQSFLNMTNIHFIELSTTKRRHTTAPEPSRESQDNVDATLEACFAAAATTLPLLELYQHATRELKSYISSGRKIIRTIEVETLAEQPPLFREYVDARPDVKMVMDNQFRNGKSNARLQSKQGWYSWRGQLVDGLRAGLEGIQEGMQKDADLLEEQHELLDDVLPQLKSYHDQLRQHVADLEQRAEELDSVDQEAVIASRTLLKRADDEHVGKLALLQSLQQQMADKVDALSAAEELKTEMKDQIVEADRVREECRGIPMKEIVELQSRVQKIEKESGWRLEAAEEDVDEPNDLGVALKMVYKDVLRLFFYPAAFQASGARRRSGRRSKSTSGPTAPISLTFSPKEVDDGSLPPSLSTEQRFFLQQAKSQLQVFSMMPRGSILAKTLLKTVSTGWDMASKVSNEVRLLNMAGITNTSILSDEKMAAKLILVLQGKGRVDLNFDLRVSLDADGATAATTSVGAKAEYGSIRETMTRSKSHKVQQALSKEVEGMELGTGAWIKAAQGFEQWVNSQTTNLHFEPAPPVPEVKSVPEPTPAPIAASTNAQVPRSPLATKKLGMVQKRSIPVPQQRQEKIQLVVQQRDKENIPPPSSSQEMRKPAIAPELQEVMMHTPIKRVGALRRSPVGGSGI